MADHPGRDDRRPANDPASRRAEDHPRQSEVNAERASRARAKESGRGAAKWFGIGLAALVLILVVGGLLGGGSWIWAPTPDEAGVEEVE